MTPSPSLHKKNPKVALVIPAKNEETTVGSVVHSAISTLVSIGYTDIECLVVNDNSKDHTSREASRAGADVLTLTREHGLASAFRLGTSTAIRRGSEIIVHIDADAQYECQDLPVLMEAYRCGSDLVVGNRLHHRPYGMRLGRYMANIFASKFVSQLTGSSISDTQSGFRVFSASVASEARVAGSFTYTQEQLIRYACIGFKVSEVPVQFRPRLHGRSRLVTSTPGYAYRVIPDLLAAVRDMRGHRQASVLASAAHQHEAAVRMQFNWRVDYSRLTDMGSKLDLGV